MSKTWYWVIGITVAVVVAYFVWKSKTDKTSDEKKNLLAAAEAATMGTMKPDGE
jgi:hypothetical protein